MANLTIGGVYVLKEKGDSTLNFEKSIKGAEKIIGKINTENNTASDSESA